MNLKLFITINVALFLFALVWNVLYFTYAFRRRAKRGSLFPDRKLVTILFEERWASGKSSAKRFGGASNCLLVTITRTELWVTPHFPFSALAAKFDLEHRIPLELVSEVRRQGNAIDVFFSDRDGDSRSFRFRLRDPDTFLQALSNAIESSSEGIAQ